MKRYYVEGDGPYSQHDLARMRSTGSLSDERLVRATDSLRPVKLGEVLRDQVTLTATNGPGVFVAYSGDRSNLSPAPPGLHWAFVIAFVTMGILPVYIWMLVQGSWAWRVGRRAALPLFLLGAIAPPCAIVALLFQTGTELLETGEILDVLLRFSYALVAIVAAGFSLIWAGFFSLRSAVQYAYGQLSDPTRVSYWLTIVGGPIYLQYHLHALAEKRTVMEFPKEHLR